MADGDLRALEAKWRQTMRQRADGGRNAVAGFHYQFQSTLLRTVRRFLEDKDARGEDVIAECLSDVRSVEGDGIVVTQIKRRHTGKSVRAALDELWDIDQLAADFPALRPRLRFNIQAASSELVDVHKAKENWRQRHEQQRPGDGVLIEDFIRRVEIKTISDPRRELHALLHEKFRASDPVGTVRRWLARLVEAADSGHGFLIAARDIWGELVTLDSSKRRQPDDFQLWRNEYTPPSTVERGGYLTGQRPMLYHLRQGYFADRSAALDKVEQGFLNWADSRPAFVDNTVRLPVFWISGRSGAGKSVLMLQLLSRLHTDGVARILWLGDKPQRLSRAIEWIDRAAMVDESASHLLPVIAIDDPYQVGTTTDVAAQWQQALSMVEDLRQNGEGDRLPLIVCCGPTEQAVRFSEDFSGDVALTQSVLDNESSTDYEQLRSWFIERTGRTSPQVNEPNLLLVQLFFEWHHDLPLREFAHRFRDRLMGMDPSGTITDAVTRVLTLNRLYTGYPLTAFETLLDPVQRDRLAILQQQEHLETRGSGARRDMWIAHPHIAHILYETWFPVETSQHERTSHLRQVVVDCQDHGTDATSRNSPLWALSRALRDETGELRGRVDNDVARLLAKIYIQRVNDTLLRFSDLPIWIELATLLPAIQWSPHPVTTAVEGIGKVPLTTTGLRLTCHKLLQHAATSPGVDDAITNLLDNAIQWREWPPLAIDALQNLANPRLDAVILKRINAFKSNTVAAGIQLFHALQRSAPTEPLLVVTASMLVDAPATFRWADIAINLLHRDRRTYLTQIMSWLRVHHTRPEAGFVLSNCLRAEDDRVEMRGEIMNLATRWAAQNHRKPFANYVLEPLLRELAPSPDLAQWAENWLELGTGDRGYVVELLVRRYERTGLGIEWLQVTPKSHPSWTFVLQALLENTRSGKPESGAELTLAKDSDISKITLSWLREHVDHNRWTYIWETLWNTGTHTAELSYAGLRWLEQYSDHGSWAHLFEHLWKTANHRARLSAQGISWLENQPNHPTWPFVWQPLWETGEHTERLAALAFQWLIDHPDHSVWRHVWHSLRKLSTYSRNVTGRVLLWLEKHYDQPIWKYVWQLLWETGDHTERLATLAIHWLAERPSRDSWVSWGKGEHAKVLVERGLTWLSQNTDSPAIADVWDALRKIGEHAEKVDSFGLAWVRDRLDHPSWPYMWRPLWKAASHADELAILAMRWITEQSEHDAWPYVWKELWSTGERATQLGRLGLSWLVNSSPSRTGRYRVWFWRWNDLWKTELANRDDLCDLALDQLATMPVTSKWRAHCQLIIDWGGRADELHRLLMSRLAELAPDNAQWGFIWKAAWQHGSDRTELRERALKWLRSTTPTISGNKSPIWRSVWYALWESSEGLDELWDIALSYLRADLTRNGWQFLWYTLWNAGQRRDTLRNLAQDWLSITPETRNSWRQIHLLLQHAS